VEFLIRTTIGTPDTRLATPLATTYDCPIKWRPSIRVTTRTLTRVTNITRSQPEIAMCLSSIPSHNSRNVLNKSPPLSHHLKHLRITQTPFENYNPQTQATTTTTLHLLTLHPFNVILKMTLAAISSNSWSLHLLATTFRSHAEII